MTLLTPTALSTILIVSGASDAWQDTKREIEMNAIRKASVHFSIYAKSAGEDSSCWSLVRRTQNETEAYHITSETCRSGKDARMVKFTNGVKSVVVNREQGHENDEAP